MNMPLPETVDVWRMVASGRAFQGSLPQASLKRLIGSLAASESRVAYRIDFGKDEFGNAYLNVQANTPLTLICQRTLESFVLPVQVDTRLGLITHEREEALLPTSYEPFIVENSQMHLADIIEDELILALPLIPVDPASEVIDLSSSDTLSKTQHEETPQQNPFAILEQWKKAK